jgi:hypothetical protein
VIWSGWPDSNRRPLAPKASALAKLRYSPLTSDGSRPAGPVPWPGTARCVPVHALHHSPPGRRSRLTSERRRFAASRRSCAPRPGRVARRWAGGGAVASVRMVASRFAAAWRLRSWDRCSEAVTVSTPPTSLPARARIARSLSAGGSTDVAARSKDSSTRLSAVFTDCPPGPGDREKRHDSSAGGIIAPRTLTGGATEQGSGAGRAGLATGAGTGHRAVGRALPRRSPHIPCRCFYRTARRETFTISLNGHGVFGWLVSAVAGHDATLPARNPPAGSASLLANLSYGARLR